MGTWGLQRGERSSPAVFARFVRRVGLVRVGLERGAPDGDPLAGQGAAEGVAGEFDGALAPLLIDCRNLAEGRMAAWSAPSSSAR